MLFLGLWNKDNMPWLRFYNKKKSLTDAKEFECDVCHAKFKVLYILQRHKAIHQVSFYQISKSS